MQKRVGRLLPFNRSVSARVPCGFALYRVRLLPPCALCGVLLPSCFVRKAAGVRAKWEGLGVGSWCSQLPSCCPTMAGMGSCEIFARQRRAVMGWGSRSKYPRIDDECRRQLRRSLRAAGGGMTTDYCVGVRGWDESRKSESELALRPSSAADAGACRGSLARRDT